MLELDSEFAAKLPVPKPGFDWFLMLHGDVYRDMPDRRTLRFELGGAGYFIKIHSGVGWREIFKNLFQGRLPIISARNEYLAIQRLTELKVETMRLVGYGNRGWNPARRESFVITEELAGTVSLEDFCAPWALRPPPVPLKRALIERVAKMARALHENGINHRDLYICHFLLRQPCRLPDDLHLHLIDLHRVQIREATPVRWLVKDLAGLHFSSMDIGLTRRDKLRFLRTYRNRSLRDVLNRESAFWEKVEKKAMQLYRSP